MLAFASQRTRLRVALLRCPSMFHLKKKKVKGWPDTRVGTQSQSSVAIAIYSPGPRADCHSADIGVGVSGQGRWLAAR